LSTIIHTLFLQTHSFKCPTHRLLALLEDTKTVIVDLWRPAFILYCAAGYTKRYYLLAGFS